MRNKNIKYFYYIVMLTFLGLILGLNYPNFITRDGFLIEYIIEKNDNTALFNIFYDYINFLLIVFLAGFSVYSRYICLSSIFIKSFLLGVSFSVSLRPYVINNLSIYECIKYCVTNLFTKYFLIIPLYVIFTYICVLYKTERNYFNKTKNNRIKKYILFLGISIFICFFNTLFVYFVV